MKPTKRYKKQLTVRFLHRSVLFLLSCMIALVLLFVFGNLQEFLDASQFILLHTLVAIGALLFLVALATFGFEFYFLWKTHQKQYIFLCLFSLCSSTFGFIFMIFASSIILLTLGVEG